jgi:hypothetical protein
MSAPIITTIASSQFFTISTAGSAYFYPKILDSNFASLSSESNADGNGSSFGHFYKNLLSTSSGLVVLNEITFCNICNYAADSTATVSLWTSTGKYLQVPLVGPTTIFVRKNMIDKEGVIINTVSTSSLYSTSVYYDPTTPPESDFFFKEGTYSTIIASNAPESPGSNYFSFADAVYLNCHKVGVDVTFTSDHTSAGDSVVISSENWDAINTTLDYYTSNANIIPVGDLIFTTYCSNATGSLRLNLSMCNLEPATFYRLQDSNELSAIATPSYCNFTDVTVCNFKAIQFPGDGSYLDIPTDLKYFNSGSICVLSQIDSNAYDANHVIFNSGYDYIYKVFPTCNYDSITFGSNVVDHVLPTYPFDKWHFITITHSNYIQNRSNYYDLYTYYDTVLQYSNLSNVGHTSSFISTNIIVGSNYPGSLMYLSIFDRCLCKREIELYLDIIYSGDDGGTGTGSGSGSGSGCGSGSGGGT